VFTIAGMRINLNGRAMPYRVLLIHSSPDLLAASWIKSQTGILGFDVIPLEETELRAPETHDLLALLVTPQSGNLSKWQGRVREAVSNGKLAVGLIHPEAPWNAYGMLEGLTYLPLETSRLRYALESNLWNLSKLSAADQRDREALFCLATIALAALAPED
jgi:hypothetical protein